MKISFYINIADLSTYQHGVQIKDDDGNFRQYTESVRVQNKNKKGTVLIEAEEGEVSFIEDTEKTFFSTKKIIKVYIPR